MTRQRRTAAVAVLLLLALALAARAVHQAATHRDACHPTSADVSVPLRCQSSPDWSFD